MDLRLPGWCSILTRLSIRIYDPFGCEKDIAPEGNVAKGFVSVVDVSAGGLRRRRYRAHTGSEKTKERRGVS
jgi:hypothetical protein